MSQDEFGQMYWNGVRDALRMVQTFLFYKDKNPEEQRSTDTFVSEALDAVRQKCAPCLKDILGVSFGEGIEDVLPGLQEIPTEPMAESFPEVAPEPVPEPTLEPEPEITPPPVPPVPEPATAPEPIPEPIPEPTSPELFLVPEEPIPPPEPTFEPTPEPEPTFEPTPEPEPTFEPTAEPSAPEPAVEEEDEDKPKRRTFFF
ncbi:MAG: hypothetical protein ACFE8F_05060 [Promethearchaeota archaeon]